MDGCKSYCREEIMTARDNYHVGAFSEYLSEVDDICLKMGYSCSNKSSFNELKATLQERLYAITKCESDLDNLFKYAKRVMTIASNYSLLTK
jgi:hypothetical protein